MRCLPGTQQEGGWAAALLPVLASAPLPPGGPVPPALCSLSAGASLRAREPTGPQRFASNKRGKGEPGGRLRITLLRKLFPFQAAI